MIVTIVPRDALDTAWPDARALLEDAVKTQRHYHITDVYEGIQTECMNSGLSLKKISLSRPLLLTVRMPNCKTLSMDWVGGDKMGKWLPDALEIPQDMQKTITANILRDTEEKAGVER